MLGTAGFGVGLVMAMLDDDVNGVNAGVADKAVGATVLATVAWFIWRVTVYPCVEARESGLTVRQPFASYKAPWHAVGTPDALDGLRVPLAGHGVVTSWAFSASLLADFRGDLAANNAVVPRSDAPRGGPRRPQRRAVSDAWAWDAWACVGRRLDDSGSRVVGLNEAGCHVSPGSVLRRIAAQVQPGTGTGQ